MVHLILNMTFIPTYVRKRHNIKVHFFHPSLYFIYQSQMFAHRIFVSKIFYSLYAHPPRQVIYHHTTLCTLWLINPFSGIPRKFLKFISYPYLIHPGKHLSSVLPSVHSFCLTIFPSCLTASAGSSYVSQKMAASYGTGHHSYLDAMLTMYVTCYKTWNDTSNHHWEG